MIDIDRQKKSLGWISLGTFTIHLITYIVPIQNKLRCLDLAYTLMMTAMAISSYFLIRTNYTLKQHKVYSLLSMTHVYGSIILLAYISFKGRGYLGDKNDSWCMVELIVVSYINVIMLAMSVLKMMGIKKIQWLMRISIILQFMIMLMIPAIEIQKNILLGVIVLYIVMNYVLYFFYIKSKETKRYILTNELVYDRGMLISNTIKCIVAMSYVLSGSLYLRTLLIYILALGTYHLQVVIYNACLKTPWDELLKKSKDTTLRVKDNEENRRMIINLSHELKTPINVIVSALELMHMDMRGNKELMKYINQINRYCEGSMKIIKSLIEWNKIKMNYSCPKYEYYNGVQMVENVVSAMCETYELDNIIFNTEEEEICIKVDKAIFQKTLISLIFRTVQHAKDKEIQINMLCEGEKVILLLNTSFLCRVSKSLNKKDKSDIGSYMAGLLSREMMKLNNIQVEVIEDKVLKMIIHNEETEKMEVVDEQENIQELKEMIVANYTRKMYFEDEVC